MMLRVKGRSQFKVFLFLLSVFFTISNSYARDADPCDEIVGNWVGKWATEKIDGSGSCEWDVSAVGTKYKDILRLEVKFSHGKGSPWYLRCKNATQVYSGACEDARISVDFYSGTIFGGVIALHGVLPKDSVLLHKKN